MSQRVRRKAQTMATPATCLINSDCLCALRGLRVLRSGPSARCSQCASCLCSVSKTRGSFVLAKNSRGFGATMVVPLRDMGKPCTKRKEFRDSSTKHTKWLSCRPGYTPDDQSKHRCFAWASSIRARSGDSWATPTIFSAARKMMKGWPTEHMEYTEGNPGPRCSVGVSF